MAIGVSAPALPDETEVVLNGKVRGRDVCQRAVSELLLNRNAVEKAHAGARGDACLDRGDAGKLDSPGKVADGELARSEVSLQDLTRARAWLSENKSLSEELRDAVGALSRSRHCQVRLSGEDLAPERRPVKGALGRQKLAVLLPG